MSSHLIWIYRGIYCTRCERTESLAYAMPFDKFERSLERIVKGHAKCEEVSDECADQQGGGTAAGDHAEQATTAAGDERAGAEV